MRDARSQYLVNDEELAMGLRLAAREISRQLESGVERVWWYTHGKSRPPPDRAGLFSEGGEVIYFFIEGSLIILYPKHTFCRLIPAANTLGLRKLSFA